MSDKEKECSVYRQLTDTEIDILVNNLCIADEWGDIEVRDGFDPTFCRQVRFSGKNKLGAMNATYTELGGIKTHSGISHCYLHNCTIGDNVVIKNVHRYIANYDIGDCVCIENVDTIVVDGFSSFGNGVRVPVLNETGGREVILTNNLSSHIAYLMAFYRHDEELIKNLFSFADSYAESVKSDRGKIDENVKIKDCGSIINMYVGAGARLLGVSFLKNGSLNSNPEAPVRIGFNVIAENFICASGSSVFDGCTISNCFIGQGTHMGHLFSAHDSLFFANCQAENGEACAVFAGPYTVTMHKSSLLIAGYYSFLNAGSGSNQSNHLYKLGPIHQGVVERGSKTTSDSYILWPSHIGPFSLVMGRHVHHVDTSKFPFSYLIEEHNQTYLVPGVNIRSVGTIRDAKKWPNRDKRTDSKKTDCINFNLLSPYTVGKMLHAHRILSELSRLLCNDGNQEYVYRNMRIQSRALAKGLHFYEMAIVKFLGNSLIKKLEDCPCTSDAEVIEWLRPRTEEGLGVWLDICGMIAPRSSVLCILDKVKNGTVNSLEELNEEICSLHKNYYNLEWTWAYNTILEWFGLKPEDLTRTKVAEIVRKWKDCVVSLDKMLYEDARKEFTMNTQVGFGIDVKGDEKSADFDTVRGNFESNPFVLEILDHIEKKSALGDLTLAKLGAV